MENKEKTIDSFKFNIEAVLDDKSLDDIADKLYEKLKDKFASDLLINGSLDKTKY